MKKIIIMILAALAFSWAPVVSAEQSPESVVTCAMAGENYLVLSKSISGAINAEQCGTHPSSQPDPCSLASVLWRAKGAKWLTSL